MGRKPSPPLHQRIRAGIAVSEASPGCCVLFQHSALAGIYKKLYKGETVPKAVKSIDGPDVEALVAFGANLPFAKLADEAERWLDKPVLQINATTYWHALRSAGITDKVYGYGSLLARF